MHSPRFTMPEGFKGKSVLKCCRPLQAQALPRQAVAIQKQVKLDKECHITHDNTLWPLHVLLCQLNPNMWIGVSSGVQWSTPLIPALTTSSPSIFLCKSTLARDLC